IGSRRQLKIVFELPARSIEDDVNARVRSLHSDALVIGDSTAPAASIGAGEIIGQGCCGVFSRTCFKPAGAGPKRVEFGSAGREGGAARWQHGAGSCSFAWGDSAFRGDPKSALRPGRPAPLFAAENSTLPLPVMSTFHPSMCVLNRSAGVPSHASNRRGAPER